jgi:peptide deformylase
LYGTDVLRKKAKPLQKVDDDVVQLIVDMFETMRVADGIGLAANQVGRLQRVIVIDVSGIEELKEIKPITLLNPQVLSREGSSIMEEGCLSIPSIRDDVERSDRIIVSYRDASFHEQTLEAQSLLARVILHEIDHLNGVLFLDQLPKARRKMHQDQLKKIRTGEIDVKYPVVSAVDEPVS